MKTREIAIQLKLEDLDRKICNDTNLNDEILTELEALKSELYMMWVHVQWRVKKKNPPAAKTLDE